MFKPTCLTLWTTALVAGGLSDGCVTPRGKEEARQAQKEIPSKLDKVGTGPARYCSMHPEKTYSLAIGDSAVKGPKDAWVTIIEVLQFQSPYSKRVGSTLKRVTEKYAGEVRIAFKHNALRLYERAKPAARAAECALEQGKFWEMHDVLFENHRRLEDSDLGRYAGQIGLNTARFRSCYTSNKYDEKIDGDQRQVVSLGVDRMPAVFINGRHLAGVRPQEAYERLVEEELKKAKASGLSKSEYYAKAIVERGIKRP